MSKYNPQEEILQAENFFPKLIHKEIYNCLVDEDINWKYNPTLSYGKKNTYNSAWAKFSKIQETDGFGALVDKNCKSYNYITNNIRIFLRKSFNIEISQFLRVMFVIIPPNPSYNHDCHLTPHTDSADKLPYKNFLYYINDNDAETLFYNQKFDWSQPTDFSNQEILYRVKPVQGKAIVWDGSIFHSGNVSKFDKRITLNAFFK